MNDCVAPAILTLAVTVFAACGESATPAPPQTPAVPTAEGSAPSAPGATGAESPPPVQSTAYSKKPLDLTSACGTPTTLYLGEDPAKKEESDISGKRNVDANGTLPLSRRGDGSQTVWLLDDKGAPLIKVSVTRNMKKVEIGKSCRTLDAR